MQRCKYPTKTMNITQSYTGTYSHSKNYNGSPRDYPIDDNCGTTGRSYFYAPFDCSIKRIYGVGAKGTNTIWIQSQAPVQTPSFTDYVTIMVIHPNDDTLGKLKVGQVFRQGAAMFLVMKSVTFCIPLLHNNSSTDTENSFDNSSSNDSSGKQMPFSHLLTA